MKIEYIAHEGKKYTIEWYYDARNRSVALEYFNELSIARKKKLINLFITMGEVGKIFKKDKFNYEEDKVYAFKPSPDRFLCFFFTGAKIIVTNAYEKKSEKMPVREKERALKYKEDYAKRVAKGDYYE